ncbi:hypothetical protein [Marinoscillum sp.]|uniref:hypothetical protein n=1 Tax=Marinoscillum sp. TaxID=2024838 RepID=UPI003BAA19B1
MPKAHPRILLILLITLTPFLTSGQSYTYQQIELPSVDLAAPDTFRITKSILIDADHIWVQGIAPPYDPAAGLLHDGKFDLIYSEQSDGRLLFTYTYVSPVDSANIIMVAVLGFEDGLAGQYVFEYYHGEVFYLGHLYVLKKVDEGPLFGFYNGVYPEKELTIRLEDDQLIFDYSGAEFVHMHDYQEDLVSEIRLRHVDDHFEVVKQRN